MKISAIIPTKNRPESLERAVISVIAQDVQPDELIILDQSSDQKSRLLIETFFRKLNIKESRTKLIYLYMPQIKGLVEAKKEAVSHVSGDIVCFLEDDVAVCDYYFSNVLRFFSEYQNAVGVCGVEVIDKPISIGRWIVFEFFHRGLFEDKRRFASLFKNRRVINSKNLSGGISAFRKHVFSRVFFNPGAGYFALEDIEFSRRVNDYYGMSSTYIDTSIRTRHYYESVNRVGLVKMWERKIREYKKFYIDRRGVEKRSVFYYMLLMSGLFISAINDAVRKRTFKHFEFFFK